MIKNLTFMKKLFLITILFSFLEVPFIYCQDLAIKGTIKEKGTGYPVVCYVFKKGTTKGVYSDENGKFSIEGKINTVLVFRSLGYKSQELIVNDPSKSITVEMEVESEAINEVVVIAGATVNKQDLTGSVSSINSKKITNVPVTTISSALNGKIAGVRPNGSSVRVRGYNSISYGTTPIFVIDGVVTEGAFDMLNIEDIASIDVLKDASATSIYGARGSNGVVVVTTKKGTKEGGQINYSSWIGFEKFKNDLPTIGSVDLYQLRADAITNSYIDQNPNENRTAFYNNLINGTSPYFDNYEKQSYATGTSYNWINELIRTGIEQNHNLSFSGSSPTSSYYLSFNYVDNKGWLEKNKSKRFSGRVNLENKVKSWLTVGTNSSFTRSEANLLDGSAYSVALFANPMYPINDTSKTMYWGKMRDLDSPNPLLSKKIDWDESMNRFLSSSYISITPYAGLVFRSTVSFDVIDKKSMYYRPSYTYQGSRENQNGEANHSKDSWLNTQIENTLTYKFKFKEDHSFDLLAGMSMSRNNWDNNSITAYKFISDDFSYKYLGGSYAEKEKYISSDFTSSTIGSYYFKINYNYRNKYFATITSRWDGSSRFGKNNKWGYFPSLALAWDLKQEKMFSDIRLLSSIKLKFSYGMSGNQNIPLYSYTTKYYPTGNGGTISYKPSSTLGSPNIRWEKQKQLNAGIDFSIFDNRYQFVLEYFNIQNEDLLMYKPLASTSGFSGTIDNVGAIKNSGVELTINANLINKQNLKWNFSFNVSSDKNTVTKLYGKVDAIYNYSYQTILRTGNLFLNESLNSIYALGFNKIAQNEDMPYVNQLVTGGKIIKPGDPIPIDYDQNDTIDNRDMRVVGKLDPKLYGGFSTEFIWKNFAVNAVFNYQIGAKTLNSTYEYMMNGSGQNIAHPDILNRWTEQNTNTNIPRAYYQQGARYQLSELDWALKSNSFLNLSTISISYEIPTKYLNLTGLNKFKIYFSGNNLLNLSTNKMSTYLQVKKYVIGVNISL